MKFTLAAIISASTLALATNVLELSPDNWDQFVGNGRSGLVNFYSKGCNHCQKLEPVYEQLADAYWHAQDSVFIGRIEAAEVGRPIKKRYGVTQYPTLKWFSVNGTLEDHFHDLAPRTLYNMAHFVHKNSNIRSNLPPLDYLSLDTNNFDDIALDPTKNVFVAFTAQWCKHCNDMKPAFEKAAKTFANEADVIFATVEGHDAINAPLMKRFKVNQYPTLFFFSKDNKEPEEYIYGLDEAQMIEFLNLKCGYQRSLDGGPNDEAGRIPRFDALARQFAIAPTDQRAQIYQKTEEIASSSALSASKHYLHVMKTFLRRDTNELVGEVQRLDTLLKDGSVSHKGADAIKVKLNILRAFINTQGEVGDQAKAEPEIVRKSSGEL